MTGCYLTWQINGWRLKSLRRERNGAPQHEGGNGSVTTFAEDHGEIFAAPVFTIQDWANALRNAHALPSKRSPIHDHPLSVAK